MLKEIKPTKQDTRGFPRKWFSDNEFDLIVWYAADDTIAGFQLCYDKGVDERALTWRKGKGFSHNRVDDGESDFAGPKRTPILVPDGVFDRDSVMARFQAASAGIDESMVSTVLQALRQYS